MVMVPPASNRDHRIEGEQLGGGRCRTETEMYLRCPLILTNRDIMWHGGLDFGTPETGFGGGVKLYLLPGKLGRTLNVAMASSHNVSISPFLHSPCLRCSHI